MAIVREKTWTDGQTRRPAPELKDLSLPELMRRLADETSTLVRQEIQLAKTELTEKGKLMALGAGELAGAALIALFALGALTAAFIAALALVLPVWLAALIVFVVYLAVAGVLALMGRKQLARGMPPVPEQTVSTIKEDVEWVKTRPRSERT
jgi:hypothetical protein